MELKPIFEVDTYINQSEYCWLPDGFSDEELMWLNNLKNLYPYDRSSVDPSMATEKRKSRIRYIPHDDRSSWVFDKLKQFIIDSNKTAWNFDLYSIIDSLQHSEYLEGDFCNLHMDIGPGTNHRKISVIVQLSDPSEYDGGDLEVWSEGKFEILSKEKGCAFLFPSFILHRVTPITRGMRKSLVIYAGGGSYK